MGRHAFLIMAHNQYGLLSRLVSALIDKDSDIYVHIDKKAKDFNERLFMDSLGYAAKKNVYFVKRYRCHWGGGA